MMFLFISREQSTIDVESSKDTSAAAGTEKVGLADWESARPTWVLASTGAVALADWEVGLGDLEHAAIGLANFELEGSPLLLLIGA
jgi:hypothetical protein